MGCRENATGRSVGRLVGLVGWGGGMGRKRRKGPLCPGGFSVGFEYVVMDRHDRICHHYFSKEGRRGSMLYLRNTIYYLRASFSFLWRTDMQDVSACYLLIQAYVFPM